MADLDQGKWPQISELQEQYNSSDWKPISLTLVEYPKGDLIGQLLAWISLAPMAIGSGFITLILFRRDLHTVTFFIGLLLNESLNKLLKHTIQEPRPIFREHMYAEYGMPSNHSQFMTFFATYVLLFMLIRLPQINQNSLMERFWRLLVIIGTWLISALVCYGRIYLQYHSGAQVVVGVLLGIGTGTIWFVLTQFIISPFYPKIVSWKVAEFLLLRDTTLIPNVMWFEYTVTRKEASARSRKLNSMKSQ